MTPSVLIDRRRDLAVLTFRQDPVNALSREMRSALFDGLESLNADERVRGVVLTGAGRCFSAGADIAEFRGGEGREMTEGRDPSEITELIEGMRKPVLAALHGLALGGGLELAMGCHFRVAAAGTQLGLPEIHLGLLPGAGGTQRLPRLVGPKEACDLVLSGNPVDAEKARAMGLIDAVVGDDLVDDALRQLESFLARGAALRRVRDLPIDSNPPTPTFYQEARSGARSRRAASFAAQRIVDCIEAASSLPFEEGLRFEREQFMACHASPAAAALQHVYFARREARKVSSIPAGTQERRLERVGIVGAGTMGRGIAMAFADAGYPVTLVESDSRKAEAALAAIGVEYRRLAASGRLGAALAEARVARVGATVDDGPLQSCDLVIEAVFEDLALKRDVCRRLGGLCKPGAIIASNTSTLDVNDLAKASGREADFLGLHFFSPANVMRLLEVVRGDRTAADVLATAMALGRRLGKDAVSCGVCYGFIGNRMLEPYLREAEFLLLEGASPRRIDRALEDFGMAMGPCRMLDLAGVDVAAQVVIERERQGGLPSDPLYRIVARELMRIGRFGQKSGEGFYRYEGRKAVDDAQAAAIIRKLGERHGIEARADIPDREIVERCLLPLINEGFRILEEGIACRSSDIDVVWLSGYGFPPERGGPMFLARQWGLEHVKQRLLHYAGGGDRHGYWTPAPTIDRATAPSNTACQTGDPS